MANEQSQKPKQAEKQPASLSEKNKTLIWIAVIGMIGNITVAYLAAAYGKAAVDEKAREAKSSVGAFLVPTGTIVPYGGPISKAVEEQLENSGWLPCDGRSVPQKKYPQLYEAIRDFWGKGNGYDEFTLPNLQGLFLRGVDSTGKNDPDFTNRVSMIEPSRTVGPLVGSYQLDVFHSHTHEFIDGQPWDVSKEGAKPRDYYSKESKGNKDAVYSVDQARTNSPAGGRETRPKNAYVNYVIKSL